ncbi:MAG: aminopeptidase P family protein [Bacteroidota bacterium]
MFSPNAYSHRRNALASLIEGNGLIAIFGNEYSPMNYEDNVYPFRQDSNFLYFAGINEAHHLLLINLDDGKCTIYGDDLSLDHIVWMGEQQSMAEKSTAINADSYGSYQDGLDTIKQVAQQGGTVHYLPPYRTDRVELLADCLDMSMSAVRHNFSEPLTKAVIRLRSTKSDAEVKEMELAVNITRDMHHAAMRALAVGQLEADIAGLVEGIAIKGQGRLAYPCIATVNGQILHNHHHHTQTEEGQLFLLDSGASSPTQYAGDITRTFPVSTKFTPFQKDIYQIVLDAQEAAIINLRPGYRFLDAHLTSAKVIAKGLTDLGLMKGDPAEAVEAGAHALFFPHGLGHMIGLDVHDMEDLNEDWVGYDETIARSSQFGLKSLRLAKSLEAGHVLTVEPGIYFIPALIERWASEGQHSSFINYEEVRKHSDFGGIRIEDNILITSDNHRILGKSIAKKIAEVEQLRQGVG